MTDRSQGEGERAEVYTFPICNLCGRSTYTCACDAPENRSNAYPERFVRESVFQSALSRTKPPPSPNSVSSPPTPRMPRRVMKRPKLEIVPLNRAQAQSYVRRWHRHHRPSLGGVFQMGVADEDGTVRGVAMVGRPVSRGFDDGVTLEVNRVATDGCDNACSALYGAAWRAAKALGYRRLITYTLASEGGASLRGAGFKEIAKREGRSWGASSVSRPRDDTYTAHGEQKVLWEVAA